MLPDGEAGARAFVLTHAESEWRKPVVELQSAEQMAPNVAHASTLELGQHYSPHGHDDGDAGPFVATRIIGYLQRYGWPARQR